MAINYSLICWGGRAGKTVSISASTDVVTLTNHGAYTGKKVWPGGTLPAELSVGTAVWIRSTGTNTFTLHTSEAGALANTGQITFAGSSTYAAVTLTSDLWYLFDTTWGPLYGGVDKTRYGSAGSERVYDGNIAWRTARAAAITSGNQYDTEYVEYGDEWVDYYASSTSFALDLAVVSIQMESKINGYRTEAFHDGALSGAGYAARPTSAFYVAYDFNRINIRIDGIRVELPSNDQTAFNLPSGTIPAGSINAEIANCVISGNTGSYNQTGILHRSEFGAKIHDNIVYQITATSGTRAGIYFRANAGKLGYVYNNIVTGCDRGIYGDGTVDGGYIFNNISSGNTTNWGTQPTGITQAANNAGESASSWSKGAAWYVGTDTRVNVTTSDFTSSTDFTPKLTSSPQVDAGVAVYGGQDVDIVGNERPAYNNGSTETWDLGAFEKNLCYTPPVQRDLVFTGQNDGAQIIVYQNGLTGTSAVELQRNNSTSGDETYSAGVAGVVVDYTILQLGYNPIHVTGVSLDAETTTVTVQQTKNRAWVASSGLTYGTDLSYTAGTPNILKLRIASTLQNALCCLYEAFINSATNTALRNIDFPVQTNGPNSFSLIATEWRGWSTTGTATSNTSLDLLSRDGMRYLASNGTTVNATWAAFYTPDTPAGMQVKYKQSSGGSPVAALTTGPIDQLIQIYGGASYGAFDYTGFMEMRAPKPGYSQPKPDFDSIYGTLEDQLYVSGLLPVLQYATTNADPGGMTFNNTTKTSVLTASRTVLQLYQGAQWWANQDSQWSADIPLVSNSDGTVFTQPSTWTLSGLNYITGTQTISGGTITLAGPATYTPTFASATVQAQGEGTYTFSAAGITLEVTPTADNVHYVLSDCTLTGTLTVHNTTAHPCVVEVPSGTTTSSTGNTGGAITFSAPNVYQAVTITDLAANYRVQLYDASVSAPAGDRELYNAVPGTTSLTWTDPTPAAANRLIRLRVTASDPAPGEAIIMIDQNIGTCGTTESDKAISFVVQAEEDTVYTANAIDGSTVTGMVIDDANLRLEIDSGTIVTYDGVDVVEVDARRIYAYETYWLGTEEGIRDEARFIDAIDAANLHFNVFKLKNNTSGPVYPVLIVGAYVVDAATGVAASLVDYTGGPIHFAPDHVVNNVVSVGGENIITGDIATVLAAIPSASSNAAALATRVLEGSYTWEQAFRILAAPMAGKVSGAGTGTETFLGLDGTTPRVTATVDESGNRTAITYDGT